MILPTYILVKKAIPLYFRKLSGLGISQKYDSEIEAFKDSDAYQRRFVGGYSNSMVLSGRLFLFEAFIETLTLELAIESLQKGEPVLLFFSQNPLRVKFLGQWLVKSFSVTSRDFNLLQIPISFDFTMDLERRETALTEA